MECERDGGWWWHLRRCARCGHVGCCDGSLSTHARRHAAATGHPVVQSFEPGEEWFWDYPGEAMREGPALTAPTSHPADQPAPGPAGRVPEDWREILEGR
ncbi:UBP-type zinc finger domain-containing protein [Demequina pelophila]|uniref:UBP-type zinc finger domain-containing protein n=1 Tax=Demequina pelophila TaxID=1638984 RepID=UPI003F717AFB